LKGVHIKHIIRNIAALFLQPTFSLSLAIPVYLLRLKRLTNKFYITHSSKTDFSHGVSSFCYEKYWYKLFSPKQ